MQELTEMACDYTKNNRKVINAMNDNGNNARFYLKHISIPPLKHNFLGKIIEGGAEIWSLTYTRL